MNTCSHACNNNKAYNFKGILFDTMSKLSLRQGTKPRPEVMKPYGQQSNLTFNKDTDSWSQQRNSENSWNGHCELGLQACDRMLMIEF